MTLDPTILQDSLDVSNLKCSFCEQPKDNVEKIFVKDPNTTICLGCVVACLDAVQQSPEKQSSYYIGGCI